MKKIILSAAMLFAIGFTAKAQDIKYGIKAGVNFATLTGDDVPEELESRTGFHVGAVAEFKLTEQFSIQPELIYSQQGTKFDTVEEGVSVKSTLKFDYLNLPILAKYYILEGLSLEAGPQIGYRVSAKVKLEAPSLGEAEYDTKDTTKAIEFGVAGGVAYDLPMGLFFQARYAAGLSKINDDNDGDIKNGVFSLSAGFKF